MDESKTYGLTRRDLLKCAGLYLIAKLIPGCDNPNSPRNMEQILADSNDDNKLEEKVNTSKDNDSKFKGDYSTPEKAVISDFEAVQRGDSYEVLSNQHSKEFVDEQLEKDSLYLQKWALKNEATFKIIKEFRLEIILVKYKIHPKRVLGLPPDYENGEEVAVVLAKQIAPKNFRTLNVRYRVEWKTKESRWVPTCTDLIPLDDGTTWKKLYNE
jgi:hypothetical protein